MRWLILVADEAEIFGLDDGRVSLKGDKNSVDGQLGWFKRIIEIK